MKIGPYRIYCPDDLSRPWFVWWVDENGVRRRVKGGINRARTRAERMAAALALVERLRLEGVGEDVGARLVDWIESRRGELRRKSYQTIRSKIDVFLRWVGGRPVAAEVVGEFFEWLSARRSGCTVAAYRRFLGQAFRAVGAGELIEGVAPVRFSSSPAKYFQRHQVEQIRDYLAECDPVLWLACQFCYYCFIRPGELRLLRVGDIQFDDWKICVPARVAKNGKQQYVTIPVAFRSEVLKLARRRPAEYVVWVSDPLKPVSVNWISRRFRRVLDELGFPKEYKFYSWKHTGAVACVRAGVGVKELQVQLRHHSLEEVDKYLRQLGVADLQGLEANFPGI
ncbi:MAG: site-specific integrase [Bacteroidetes bacterium]|nr:MAG: site-specific integrase [Bacteroidota bacterium]